MVAGRKEIDDATAERDFRTDDREIDLFARGDGKKIVGFPGIGGDATGHRRDARVAGSAEDVANAALARQLPRKRMLPRTRPDDENLHADGR